MTSLSDESTALSASIVKTDRLGRTHYTREYRDEVLAAFDRSSLSGAAFARQCGIKYPTFASWVTKRKNASTSHRQPEPENPFILAEVQEPEPVSNSLQVQLAAGTTTTMTSAQQAPLLAALIKALA